MERSPARERAVGGSRGTATGGSISLEDGIRDGTIDSTMQYGAFRRPA